MNKKEFAIFQYNLEMAPRFSNNDAYPITNESKWVIKRGSPWPTNYFENGSYPYVILPDGELRVAAIARPKGNIHHPELVKGREVIGAGMLTIHDLVVTKYSNESGHYRPDMDSLYYVELVLRVHNIPLATPLIKDARWAYMS